MLAPLLHAAALAGAEMSEVVRWLDARRLRRADRRAEGGGRRGRRRPAGGRQASR